MAFKSVLSSPASSTSLEDQLDYLYARRLALEELIRSLEKYRMCAESQPSRKGAAGVFTPLAPSNAALAS